MSIIPILFIAFGLAMDAFSVAISSGLTIKQLRIEKALRIATFFGLFQAFMPLFGWLAGLSVRDFISSIDHWIALGILSGIGGKMIFESTKMGSNKRQIDVSNIYVLLMLSIATSIDALAVGLSLSFLKVSIVMPAIIIGIVTFLLSFLGVLIGIRFGHFFENKIRLAGGLILIAIGIKILIQHLVYSI